LKLVLAAALLLAATPAAAGSLPRYGAFAYSDLCWRKDTGDASGTRFLLSRTPKGARLDYEYGNGPLESARITSLKIAGDRIEAEASTADGELAISATMGSRTANLTAQFDFEKGQTPSTRTLKRIATFKAKVPECRS
jgi:hypothetical protein